MREPTRYPRPVEEAEHPASTPDLRTWWQRNATAIGTILGTAAVTVLAGTGGMTGLAHVAGIATTKDVAAIDAKVVAVVQAQQDAATVEAVSVAAINKKLDAIAKDAKAARSAALSRGKKTKSATPSEGPGE